MSNTISESERLKQLRKVLDIKQGDFAAKISTTQGHISDIENGRKNLSDRTIKLICLEEWNGKKVNEDWLRTGSGEMFVEIDKENLLMAWAGNVLSESDVSFKKRFVKMLSELDESDWETLEKIAEKLHKNG
ncbi:helix-turn-helix domain-containing protein [Clostridium sp. SL.3.18]|nr:helix-turn-helix domain-containing protein [Clostridium sp. SL.3.18]